MTHQLYIFDTWVEYIQLQVKIVSWVGAMKTKTQQRLIKFLVEELAVPGDSVKLALRHSQENPTVLPMVLWKYGLINLRQLEKIWDWAENV